MLKSLPCRNAWFAPLNIISYGSGCGFLGAMNLFGYKFDHLHTVVLVVKTIHLKSLQIKEIILLIFFWFIFHFLVFFCLFLPTPSCFFGYVLGMTLK